MQYKMARAALGAHQAALAIGAAQVGSQSYYRLTRCCHSSALQNVRVTGRGEPFPIASAS